MGGWVKPPPPLPRAMSTQHRACCVCLCSGGHHWLAASQPTNDTFHWAWPPHIHSPASLANPPCMAAARAPPAPPAPAPSSPASSTRAADPAGCHGAVGQAAEMSLVENSLFRQGSFLHPPNVQRVWHGSNKLRGGVLTCEQMRGEMVASSRP